MPNLGPGLANGLANLPAQCARCPDRRIIAFQADGSGLYTVQALWSMARESANVTVVVCANRRYRILQVELAHAGITDPLPKSQSLTDLTRPAIGWIDLAKGFGIPASRVHTDSEFAEAFAHAIVEPGPHLIEAMLN